jgi:hypothetical protein
MFYEAVSLSSNGNKWIHSIQNQMYPSIKTERFQGTAATRQKKIKRYNPLLLHLSLRRAQ